MNSIPMVFASAKGITFEWGEISFMLSMAKANELVDMIEILQSTGDEPPDDFVTDLWVGKKMLRYGGHRILIELEWLYSNLLPAIGRYHEKQHNAESYRSTEEAIRDIIDGLNL